MITTTLFLGVINAIAVFIICLRLPRYWVCRALEHHALLDIIFTGTMLAMHWGTATGVFAAMFAGLCGSGGITLARYALGYFNKGSWVSGFIQKQQPARTTK